LVDILQVFLSLIFGGLIGLSLGLLGGGGSILTVPVLVYILGQGIHVATGTSLAIVGSSALLGAFFHSRRGEVRLKSGVAFGLSSMAGAIPGVWLNRFVAGNIILILFSILMIGVAIDMLRTKQSSSRRSENQVPCETYNLKDWLKILVIGLLVGVLTGFFGVGGGFLIVPALVILGNFPPHQAVGTSLLVIAMTSFSGFLSNLSFGDIDLNIVLFFVIGGFFGVLAGTISAGRVSGRQLNRAFGLFAIFVALYLLYVNIVV
jgi:uncharacterized membrane protein YfcA